MTTGYGSRWTSRKARKCQANGEAPIAKEVADGLNVELDDRLVILTRRGPRSARVVGIATSARCANWIPLPRLSSR